MGNMAESLIVGLPGCSCPRRDGKSCWIPGHGNVSPDGLDALAVLDADRIGLELVGALIGHVQPGMRRDNIMKYGAYGRASPRLRYP